MPWAELLPNGNWRACWRDELGRKRSATRDPRFGTVLTSQAKALRAAGEQEAQARRGERGTSGRAPTWGDWCPTWLGLRRVEPSTAASDTLRIDRYLTPQWAARRVNRITRSEVQAWVNQLAAGDLAPGSIEKVYRLFSSSMTAAVRSEQVPVNVNPCAGVKLPRVAPGHERFLTRDEVDRVAGFLNEPYRTAVLLAAATGMRWGELAGLHWQRVNLAAGLVDIVETWDPTAGRVKAYPKGHNRRAVPIVGWLADALHAAQDRAGPPAASCGLEHARGGAKCRSGLVITGPHGAPMNGKNFGRRQFAEACALAGVDRVRLHDLRHTFASWLVQDGVTLQEVQRLLGHASITTTQRYAHLGVSQQDKVISALSNTVRPKIVL